MDAPLTIEIWGDLVCPFCYLGLVQLERALGAFPDSTFTLVPRAYELDPRAGDAYDRPLVELVAHKYGLDVAKAERFHDQITAEAGQLGLAWSLGRAQPSNSFAAHRLVALGQSQGRGLATLRRLLAAYFSEGRRLSDPDTLVALGTEVGLVDVEETVRGDAFADLVRADEERAADLGVSGVPATLIDGRFFVLGAQGEGAYRDTVARALSRRAAGR